MLRAISAMDNRNSPPKPAMDRRPRRRRAISRHGHRQYGRGIPSQDFDRRERFDLNQLLLKPVNGFQPRRIRTSACVMVSPPLPAPLLRRATPSSPACWLLAGRARYSPPIAAWCGSVPSACPAFVGHLLFTVSDTGSCRPRTCALVHMNSLGPDRTRLSTAPKGTTISRSA